MATISSAATLILNNATIQRQQLFSSMAFSGTSRYRVSVMGQMAADANTPFMFALYLATTGSPTNFTFSLATGPSRGAPVVGSGCALLWAGWSAFNLSVANPFFFEFDLPYTTGNYEIWLAAQNVTSPSVAGYLGFGFTMITNSRSNVDIGSVSGITCLPGTVNIVGSVSAYAETNPVGGVPLEVVVVDGSGGVNKANVNASGVLSTTSGGGTGTSVYLTDITGTIPVKVTSKGSLATAPGL